jgi:hypothetical protein
MFSSIYNIKKRNIIFFIAILLLNFSLLEAKSEDTIYNLGEKLELFVDRNMIAKMHNVNLLFHSPSKQPLSMFPLKKTPFATIIKTKNKYIAYYRANNPTYKGISKTGYPNKLTKYALSKNGINWTYPKDNIIIKEPPFTHNFSPFLDKNPKVKSNEKFKALAGVDDNLLKRLKSTPPTTLNNKNLKDTLDYWGYPKNYSSGLYSFVSSDGIHWKRKSTVPVITVKKGIKAFDSQNVSFWSQEEKCYVCFFRSWKKEINKKKKKSYWVRKVSKTTSKDFIHWTKPIQIKANLKGEQLYTTQTHPYFRAPHIYIALPTRFMSHRKNSTDIMFMSMRAGNTYFDRELKEAYIRPGMQSKRWGNRANYAALNIVPINNKEMSIYHSKSQHRYTLRIDGFASIHAGHQKGSMLTKSFIFNGGNLILNYSTSAAGSLKVEIIDSNGKPMKGFTLNDCKIMVGDKIEQKVIWKSNKNLKKLNRKVIQLKFLMKECDLYSYKFQSFK